MFRNGSYLFSGRTSIYLDTEEDCIFSSWFKVIVQRSCTIDLEKLQSEVFLPGLSIEERVNILSQAAFKKRRRKTGTFAWMLSFIGTGWHLHMKRSTRNSTEGFSWQMKCFRFTPSRP